MKTAATTTTRRAFVKTIVTSTAALTLLPPLTAADRPPSTAHRPPSPAPSSFSFPLLGDLHYDHLTCHDLDALARDKPDDLRQVREYSALTADTLPRLFAAVRDTIATLNTHPDTHVPFAIQLGDLVEGLCGTPEQTRQLNTRALDFIRSTHLGVPFLFTKGNHDITGPGAIDAYKTDFHPYLAKQAAPFGADPNLATARYTITHGNTLICFYDAYDKESLPWLEAELARRTARHQHCFIINHTPVVPYGARATWHLYSADRDKPSRDRLLQLLGKNNACVLTGHIHKYNITVRNVPGSGKFIQMAISSVIHTPDPQPRHELNGISKYNPDQINVEPKFSPETADLRRAVYTAEAPYVTQYQYADLPGYAVIGVNGPTLTATIYRGATKTPWRTLPLSDLLIA